MQSLHAKRYSFEEVCKQKQNTKWKWKCKGTVTLVWPNWLSGSDKDQATRQKRNLYSLTSTMTCILSTPDDWTIMLLAEQKSHTHACACTYVHMHTTHVWNAVSTQTHTDTQTQTLTHTHIHTHTHTHTHKHKHTLTHKAYCPELYENQIRMIIIMGRKPSKNDKTN